MPAPKVVPFAPRTAVTRAKSGTADPAIVAALAGWIKENADMTTVLWVPITLADPGTVLVFDGSDSRGMNYRDDYATAITKELGEGWKIGAAKITDRRAFLADENLAEDAEPVGVRIVAMPPADES